MKIRILIDAKQIGGVETHVMTLCEELCHRSHDCKIIFIRHYPQSVLYSICENKKINYVSCTSYKELVKLLYYEKPDVIHAHGYKANILSRIYGLFTRTSIVTTFHSGEKPVGRLILYNALDKWSSFLSKNICVNQTIASNMPFNATVLPNFIEIPSHPNTIRTMPPYQLYFIGRVAHEKGPLRFCQLAELAPNDYEWHMIGDGPLLNNCKNEHQKSVHFHGLVTKMEDFWSKVDLLCITSTYEGLPLVLLEAMSRGIPVVSFNVGSVAEVLSEPKHIVDCFNIKQMHACIDEYFTQTIEERQKMANRSRDIVRLKFSKEVVVNNILDFYLQ